MVADDIAIWETGRHIVKLNANILGAMGSFQDWCGKWGFKVSLAKKVVVLFHQTKH